MSRLRRIALRVPDGEAEPVRARLLELSPNGFEEVEVAGGSVELAVYASSEGATEMLAKLPGATVEPVVEGWEDAWRDFHRPVVAGGLWLGPPWRTPPDPAQAVVIDPGRAFGTGAHPTTRLCLQWLRATVTPHASVLDYGCGSGILAIAAAKLGAGDVAGTDIDPQALDAAADNARANGTAVAFAAPDAIRGGTFDLVVANILTNPLRMLAPALAARVRPGGRLALAGLLDAQAPLAADAYARWFTIAPWRSADGWTLLAGVRTPDASS